MKKICKITQALSVLIMTFMLSCQNTYNQELKIDNLSLHYTQPASVWEETMPLGNGRLGMMPDGGVAKENIVLNDITMWSGSRENAVNEEATGYLPKIRKHLLKGENLEAQNLMYKHFKCAGQGSGYGNGKDVPYGCFQMLANLHLDYQHDEGEISNYQRALKLKTATAFTKYKVGDVEFRRSYFVSHDNDVMVINLSASNSKSISFKLSLSRPERAEIFTKNNALIMQGQLNDGKNGTDGVRYKLKIKIKNKGGELAANDKDLSLKNADEATIIISSSTNFFDKNYEKTVDKLLKEALNLDINQLINNHIKKYKKKFDRVHLDLGKSDYKIPTDIRLQNFQTQNDPALAALYFQFGRYLMISGTRRNSLPLNLQGLWANTVQTPWNGDYHLNINVQMNYWAVEIANLSELHEPLLKFTQDLVPSGKKTARGFYNADGWVAHVISNPWLFTAPGEHASWGATNTGGAWLCQHLWQHFAFTRDKEYLKSVYPTMAEAARFFLSSMIKEPKHGWLVTAPSSSPENGFFMNGVKKPVYVCMAPTMDVQLVNELFTNVLSAAKILNIDNELTDSIQKTLPHLPPMQISSAGYLQEWLEDYEEIEPHHRHVSHLYGLYPANQITPAKTPKLAKAAKETLNRRGDNGTGWSRAWKVNFWARLQDGDRAYKLLKNLLLPAFYKSGNKQKVRGGTYPNLFCAHPPFQIDGNFGGMAGIAEMLLQSHDGFIELLPALPKEWTSGSYDGLRARGGAEISLKWENHKPKTLSIKALCDNTFSIKIPKKVVSISDNSKNYEIKDGFITLKMKKGEKKMLSFK